MNLRGWRIRGLLAVPAVVLAASLAAPASAAGNVGVLPSPFAATEGQAITDQVVAKAFDSVPEDTSTVFSASIDWGDGTVTPGTVSGSSGIGPWNVSGTHTYAEEGTYTVTVTVTDNAGGGTGSSTVTLSVNDAGLSPPPGTPNQIAGGGSAAAGAIGSFEAAIGGKDNGTATGEQSGGFRHITWDGIALDGSDPGSTTITPGHVVSVSPNRMEPWGVDLGHGVGVANDGFTSVNSSASGKFSPFSSPNVFAPFNSNRINFQIVSPAPQTSAPINASTRGLGITFLNVWQANSASIEYFSGPTLLYTAFAPVGGVGQPSFVGVVFPSAVVTSVVVTMGTAQIFSFDGTTVAGGPADSPPSGTTDLVAGDDVVLAEPSPQTTIQATAGVPVSAVLDTFSDTDPNGKAGDYTAVVNWGDHTQSSGTVSPAGGAFSVTGSHAYTKQGTYQVSTTVTDFGGTTQTNPVTINVNPRKSSTQVSCSSPVTAGSSTKCTATVTDVGGGTSITPTGSVFFGSGTTGGSFPVHHECTLAPTRAPDKAKCSVGFVPSQFPPAKAQLSANYAGDAAHTSSVGKTKVDVRAAGCSIKLTSTNIASNTTRLPVVVRCGFVAQIKIFIFASITGQPQVTLAALFRTVAENKSTKLRTKVRPGPLKKVLAAAASGQGISLDVTLTATHVAKTVTTSETVTKLHIS